MVQPDTQMVVVMVAWVTVGLTAPGVQRGLGSGSACLSRLPSVQAPGGGIGADRSPTGRPLPLPLLPLLLPPGCPAVADDDDAVADGGADADVEVEVVRPAVHPAAATAIAAVQNNTSTNGSGRLLPLLAVAFTGHPPAMPAPRTCQCAALHALDHGTNSPPTT